MMAGTGETNGQGAHAHSGTTWYFRFLKCFKRTLQLFTHT